MSDWEERAVSIFNSLLAPGNHVVGAEAFSFSDISPATGRFLVNKGISLDAKESMKEKAKG